MAARGSCLCGAVRYRVEGPLRQITACHCRQCRKTSGHYIAATAAPRDALAIDGAEALVWFASSPGIRRAFCGTCGAHLFWDVDGRPEMSIFAGSLDEAPGIDLVEHIFCADKGHYYAIADGLPHHDAYPPGNGGSA